MPPPDRRELVLVATAYAVVTLWWLWPLPLHLATDAAPGSPTPTETADWYLIVWALSWGSHQLVRAPWDLFHANSFFPSTSSLAYSEHFLGQLPTFAPVYWVTGNAVLAANLLVVVVQVACATATHALARRFVAPPAAFLAGFLFAFAPMRYLGLYHFHLLGVQYIPVSLLLVERWLRSARGRDAVLLGLAMGLQLLSSVYLAFALVIALAACVPLALWRWRRRLDGRRIVGLGAAGAVAGLAMALASLPYLRLQHLGLIPSYAVGSEAPPLGLWTAPLMVRRYLASGGVGWVGHALALIGLVVPGRNLRWPRVLGVALVVCGLVVGSGEVVLVGRWQVPTPYRWIATVIPGFESIRVPARFVIVAHLGFALLAALGAARMLRVVPVAATWPLTAGLLAAVVFTWSPLRPHNLEPQPVGDGVPPVYRWLAENGGGRAVLELPGTGFLGNARRMYFSTVHWLPIVGGYSAYPPRTASYVESLGRGLPNDRALQAIVDTVDVGWIVVHTDEWQDPRRWRLPEGLMFAAAFPDAVVLRVTRAGDVARRARLLSDRETVDGVPLQPITGPCPGRLSLSGSPPASVVRGKPARLRVLVQNDGSAPWPGLGFVPRHLVVLRACIRSLDAATCQTTDTPLRADVHPGQSVVVDVDVVAQPLQVGPRRVWIELVQAGDRSLAACGVAPLIVPIDVGLQ